MSQRYRSPVCLSITYFGRQKATRLAKQLKRRLAEAEDPEEVAKLKTDLHVAEVDIDYAKYYPFLEPYVSLYASPSEQSKGGKDDKATAVHFLHAPRPPMWAVVETLREEGQAALEKLQNRQPETGSDTTTPKASKEAIPTKAQPPKQESRNNDRNSSVKAALFQKGKTWDKAKPSRIEARAAGRNVGDNSDSDSDGGGFFEED